jgi:hypothetical protein
VSSFSRTSLVPPNAYVGYRRDWYDHDSDRIIPINLGNNLEAVDRLWDQSDEGFTDHADLVDDEDDSYNRMAIEFGDFSLELESRSCFLGDDSASIATLGIPTSHADHQMEIDNDVETDDEHQVATASATDSSSLTDSTPQLSMHDSISQLLANTSLDPTIRQAIEQSQLAAAKARKDS